MAITGNIINIEELLSNRGLTRNDKVVLVRHRDRRFDIEKLLAVKGMLEIYQSYQEMPIFHKCHYMVSFIGEDHKKARFYGVYRVIRERPAIQVPLPKEFPFHGIFDPTEGSYYDLEEDHRFDGLKGRVIIDWGNAPLAWAQWLCEKEVVEIRPKGGK